MLVILIQLCALVCHLNAYGGMPGMVTALVSKCVDLTTVNKLLPILLVTSGSSCDFSCN